MKMAFHQQEKLQWRWHIKSLQELEEFFNTKLKEPLKKLQPIADKSKVIVKKLNIIYGICLALSNLAIVYVVSGNIYDVGIFACVLAMVFIASRYFNGFFFMSSLFAFIVYMGESGYFVSIFASVLIFIAWKMHINSATNLYKIKYFSLIMNPMLKFFNASWKYKEYGHVYETYFKHSWVFAEKDFVLSGYDRLKGKHLDVKFQISNVTASTVSKDDKGEEEAGSTVFKGVVFACEFNKKLKHRTFIMPDKEEKKYGTLIGQWLQSKNRKRTSLVKMDYPEFEKEFVIYGSDDIETHYVLNHNMMKNILDFKKDIGANELIIAFYLNHFVIFCDTYYNLGTPDASNLKDFSHLEYDFEVIRSFVGVIEALKLNEKLWES